MPRLRREPPCLPLIQTFNYNAGANPQDHDRQLRDAIKTKTTQNLKETINSLPQHPLSEGHTYATLPNRTNIVTMADGSIRLALPVRLSGRWKRRHCCQYVGGGC